MKNSFSTAVKIIIVFLIGLLIYLNYDIIEKKFDKVFNKFLDYAEESGYININGIGTFINDADLKKLTDSGITGDSLSFSSVYYPYYELLNSKEKKIYKQMYANAVNLKDYFIPVVNIKVEELSRVVYAINYDHPELFYLDTSYSYKYTQDGVCAQVLLNYNETSKYIEAAKINFNSAANEVITEANKYKSNYEKEKYVHDYLVKSVNYKEGSKLNQSAYSALVYKESVCSGYARSFQYIMTKLKIPTYYVTGTSTEGAHAWNLVSLSDGFYNIDVTFDDTTMSHKYFNLETSEFNKNHERTDSSIKLPVATGSKFLGYRRVSGYTNLAE